jgi:enoyl-CoA hydratase/carnithine racemase
MTEPVVLIETPAPGVGLVRINRPDARNALNMEVRRRIVDALNEMTENADIRAIMLTNNAKSFAAGADIKEMADAGYAEMAVNTQRLQNAFTAIAQLPQPVIAAITGYALGGGLELALCADFRILGESAKVGQPEIQLGVIPGGGGTQRLPRLIGPSRAKDLIFTGRFVGAQEALAMGLADRVVPDADVLTAAREMASRFVSGPALALRAAKQAIDQGLDVDLASGLQLERLQFAALFATEDQKAGMHSFVENGPGKASFTGQ